MSEIFKPMLAAKTPTDEVLSALLAKYRYYVSPKLDGIRCIIRGGRAMSRTMKEIPNRYVQQELAGLPENLDGELIVGSPTAKDCYRNTNSGVMSFDGNPDFIYHIFDQVGEAGWYDRYLGINTKDCFTKMVEHVQVKDLEELQAYESAAVAYGYEGCMLRRADGPYKQGRSTEKEGYLLKIKRFDDSEALVLDMGELLHNDNAAEMDELGHTKRSSHQANKHGGGTMGFLKVRDVHTDVEFDIGTGFDAATRLDLWQNSPVGRTIKYKSFNIGVKEKPRHPVFLGFREDL